MGDELDISVISATQESLGKWVKKPPLTEKLLRKPPFKFLHDIITTVIDTTGFMQDVFRLDELKSDNIKDRDAKIEFLLKAVDRVALVTGKPPTMRPNKTVAGHEAEKTNQFLQTLAKAIQLHKDGVGSAGGKEKSATDKSPVKKPGTRDKKEHQKSIGKEKLQKSSNGIESPKTSPSKPSANAERSRSLKPESTRPSEKSSSSKSRHAENGDATRRTGSKSKDKSPDKNRATKLAADGTKDRKDKTGSGTTATKERTESGTTKESGRDKKERSKDRKVKDRDDAKEKDRKESRRESKESKDKIDGGSRERRAGTKNERNADSRPQDRQKDTSREKSRQTSGSRTSEPVASPRKRSATFEKAVAEEDFIIAPKSNGTVASLGDGEMNDDVEPTIVVLERSQPLVRPGTARLSSAGRQLSAEQPTKALRNDEQVVQIVDEPTAALPPVRRQESAKAMETDIGETGAAKRPSTSTIRRSSARPSTARPAAPKVRVVGTAQEEPPSTEPVAAVSNIILDQDTKDDDEDDAFKVEESENFLIAQEQSSRITSAENIQGKEHGSLVNQILDTKKDLEMGSLRPMTGFRGSTNIDRQPVSDSTKRKERELLSREMEKLREGIQTVTRSANPLGKLVDYLQEDIDTMLKELDMWTLETAKYESALTKEQSKVHLELESLQNRLQEVEEGIEVQGAKICAVKANILRNEERIQKMMSLDKH